MRIDLEDLIKEVENAYYRGVFNAHVAREITRQLSRLKYLDDKREQEDEAQLRKSAWH